MRILILLILAIMVMGGGCMPIVAGTAALQGVPTFLNPIANAFGQGIGALVTDFFMGVLEAGMDMEMDMAMTTDGG